MNTDFLNQLVGEKCWHVSAGGVTMPSFVIVLGLVLVSKLEMGEISLLPIDSKAAENITRNGRHEAVRVDNMVIDNLSPEGVPVDEFIDDLHAIDGVDISTTDF